jgi:iron complex outermembrane receptor protein
MHFFKTARSLLFAGTASVAILSTADAQTARTVNFDIPAEDLGTALNQAAQQSQQEIAFDAALTRGKLSPGVKGEYTPARALDILLSGTGLTLQANAGVLTVRPKNAEAASNDGAARPLNLETVVVTGTNIAGGAPVGSPISTYTSQDIARSGALTVEDFIEKLPQNFAGGASQISQAFSSQADARANYGYGGTVNIHGLGTGSTLVLLDGRRLAPSGSDGSFVDISTIPTAALDRIELLTDGASAIYGSDAVGGVANFILKKDYDGAETTARYGVGDDLDQLKLTHTQGLQWDGGGGLASLEYDSSDALLALDRPYASSLAVQNQTLLPAQRMGSVFITAHQNLSDSLRVFADVLYSDRRATTVGAEVTFAEPGRSATRQFFGTAGLRYAIDEDWTLSLSSTESFNSLSFFANGEAAGGPDNNAAGRDQTSVWSVDGTIDGSLFQLPAGAVKVAIGGTYRGERSDNHSGISFEDLAQSSLSRNVAALFGELRVPIVSDANAIPGIKEFTVSLAGRYESYSDFGDAKTPKIGVEYKPIDELKFRGSFSESFKAPTLQDLNERSILVLYNFPDPSFPGGSALTLFSVGSGNAQLRPETSKAWTAGFDFAPSELPFSVSMTYFDILYRNKIATPTLNPFVDFFADPARFGSLFKRNPGATFVANQIAGASQFIDAYGLPYTPGDVQVFIDNRINNLSVQNVDGIDLELSSSFPLLAGDAGANLSVTKLFSYETGVTPASPVVNLVNTFENPLNWRARLQGYWTSGPWALSAAVNYSSSYRNTNTDPASGIGSWTTVDAQVHYVVPDTWISGLTATLNVENIFDTDPPYVRSVSAGFANPGYDSGNANPLGRVVSLQLTEKW